jgi:hypothetical protein
MEPVLEVGHRRTGLITALGCGASSALPYPDEQQAPQTLAAVFTDPVSGTVEWAAVESLLLAAASMLFWGQAHDRPRDRHPHAA